MLTTKQGLNFAAIKQLIAQRVANAMTAYKANRNSKNRVNNETSGSAGGEVCHVHLAGRCTDLVECLCKMETELWNLSVKGTDIVGYTKCFQELALLYPTMVTPEYKKIKRSCDLRLQKVKGEGFVGMLLFAIRFWKEAVSSWESIWLSGGEARQDPNVVMGTFLINNRYASILFDTGADKSFVSTAFSPLINIALTALDVKYTIELADGKLVGTDTIIRGCTLNFPNRPFNIDLMPIELESFDVIIGMDWLSKYHVVIVFYEKLVRLPYGNETLTIQGDRSEYKHITTYRKVSMCSWHTLRRRRMKKSQRRSDLRTFPMFTDFLDVYPERFTGLRHLGQVDFKSILVP
ncbi:putative reverse transcriptase domain-containing protein [Tanacetum coccineum]